MLNQAVTLFNNCVESLEVVYKKLLSILSNLNIKESNDISNDDYMGVYNKIVECADSGF